MSDTSLKSCGPINCQLTRAKQYMQSGTPASYCKLFNCNENSSTENSSKSPIELKELIEYCQPSNCATFWDSFSDNLPTTPKKSLKEDVNKRYLDEQNTLFNHPRCVNYGCPKQVKESTKFEESGEKKEIQIKLCGPPNCCTNLDQFKSAPKNRNAVYYCVSPSVYADLSKYELSANKEKINSGKNDITCPHFKCCEVQSKPKNKGEPAESPVTKSDLDSFGKKLAVAITKNVYKPTSNQEENNENDQNRIPSSIFLKELSKYSPKSVSYSKDDSIVTQLQSQSSLKLLNLPKKQPPIPQTVVNKISTTINMNLDDVNQKNNVQDTENVIDATDITRNVQQLEFSKNYQTNAMHTDCTKNSNCQRCLPTKNCENPNNGKCCPTNCKKKQTVIEKAPNEPCQPNTCEKLLGLVGSKKWKSCCDSKTCPINDPTSSTYNFLLRMRMCCKTRQCQLAAKICDIYEPLVEVHADLSDIGDPQYHYLSRDSSTMVSYNDFDQVIEIPYQISETRLSAEQLLKDTKENESETKVNVKNTIVEKESYSVLSHKDDDSQKSRRVSTVSWGVPNYEETHSQEQLISQATAEADKFRQTLDVLQRGSIFEDVVRHTTLSSLPSHDNEIDMPVKKSFDKCKSQLSSTIQNNDSKTKQRWYSCSALRKKFKRKKNKIPEEQPECMNEQSTWKSSVTEYQEKRKTINISLEPMQGRNQEINHVLHEI